MSPHSVKASVRGIGVAVISRHHQHVGMHTCAGESPALQHAEAVLFVDHGEGERTELDVLLHEGMGADEQLDIATLDRGQ
jgi:hypothetical protein